MPQPFLPMSATDLIYRTQQTGLDPLALPFLQLTLCFRENQKATITSYLHHGFSKPLLRIGMGFHHSCHGRRTNVQSANFHQELPEKEFRIHAHMGPVGCMQIGRTVQKKSLLFLILIHDYSESSGFIEPLNKCH